MTQKKIIILLTCLVLVLAVSGGTAYIKSTKAQSVSHIKKNKQSQEVAPPQDSAQTENNTTQSNTASPEKKVEDLRPTPISDTFMKRYYTSCLNKQDDRMSYNTQDLFCRCTAVKMQENISMEEMMDMSARGPSTQRTGNKIIIKVYAPCMEFPVRDLIYNQCKSESKLPENMCNCLADEMSAYTAKTAKTLLEKVLRSTPMIGDPLGPIVGSPSFQSHQKSIALQCLGY